MSLSHLKNLLILFMALTAVYLTGILWFDRISGRSLFYSLSAFFAFEDPNAIQLQNAHVLEPGRILVASGNGALAAVIPDTEGSQWQQTLEEVLFALVKKGEFKDAPVLDYDAFLAPKGVVYDYGFSVPSELFVGVTGQKGINLPARLKAFDTIFILPGEGDQGVMAVTFAHSRSGDCIRYTLADNALNKALQMAIGLMENGGEAISYVSSQGAGLNLPGGNSYIPQWAEPGFLYPIVTVQNPYAPRGDLTLPNIEAKVDYLFPSPENRFSGRANGGIFTFSNETTVIRYFPNDTLEYSDYQQPDARGQNTTIAGDYLTALSFLSRDPCLETTYHLSGIEAEENSRSFYFDYTLGMFPLKMPETLAAEVEMTSPIKVTVTNGRVAKYKKLVYNFYLSDELAEATVPFGAVCQAMSPAEAPEERLVPDKALLAYRMEKSKYLRLFWFLELNGATLVSPAQYFEEEGGGR